MTEKQNKTEFKTRNSGLKTVFLYFAEAARVVLISLAIILPVRYFLIQPFYVKGASMEPNFYDHEYLIIDEISYRFHEPVRGDIVVFRYPLNPGEFFIKRVVGLPGEEVEVQDGRVYVTPAGGQEKLALSESYLPSGFTNGNQKVKLSNGEYFVMGDNRLSSLDSRSFGPVSRTNIVGRVWLRGWPLERFAAFVAPAYNIIKN
ncbi:MAG: signal peptidase I [bacterium]|nr:signal peptidase I [bacterium]